MSLDVEESGRDEARDETAEPQVGEGELVHAVSVEIAVTVVGLVDPVGVF